MSDHTAIHRIDTASHLAAAPNVSVGTPVVSGLLERVSRVRLAIQHPLASARPPTTMAWVCARQGDAHLHSRREATIHEAHPQCSSPCSFSLLLLTSAVFRVWPGAGGNRARAKVRGPGESQDRRYERADHEGGGRPDYAAGTLRTASISPETIPVAIPPYCRADGVIDPRTGVDGKPTRSDSKSRCRTIGTGASCFRAAADSTDISFLRLARRLRANNPALARGFAVVSTDTGHKGAVFDASFMKDQLASLDFAYIAIGRVTVLSKEIIAQYYGRPAKHSYYDGCSTGGREGMMMSQRYPTYFDGIVSGDPAMRTGYSNIGLAYARGAFAQIAPKDASGKPDPTKDFSDGDKKLLAESIMKACDEKDGLKDGMIFNPQACHYDPAVLQCKEREDGVLPHLAASGRAGQSVRGPQGFARQPGLRARFRGTPATCKALAGHSHRSAVSCRAPGQTYWPASSSRPTWTSTRSSQGSAPTRIRL